MLDAVNTLYECNNNGILLWVNDNKLKFEQLQIIDEELKAKIFAQIKKYKDEIIAILSLNNISSTNFHLDTIYQIPTNKMGLSLAQRRLWFIDQYENGSSAYNVPLLYKLSEQVNISHLREALLATISRHEVLHSLIKVNDENKAYQEVSNLVDHPFLVEELHFESKDAALEFMTCEVNHIFNLAQNYPLRANIVSFGKTTNKYLLLVAHHIAFDGWSIDILLRDLQVYYNYFSFNEANNLANVGLPLLNIQYKDFAIWQKNYISGTRLKQQLEYWKNKLRDYESLNLITDYPREEEISYVGDYVSFSLDPEISALLRSLAKKLGVSLYSVMLSGFNLLLHIYSNQNDIVIGTPFANRYPQVEDLIGFFVNTLVIRSLINHELSLSEYIRLIGDDITEAHLYQDLPFEMLVDALDTAKDSSRHPIFQVMFGLQNFGTTAQLDAQKPKHAELFANLNKEQSQDHQLDLLDIYKVAKFDLTLMIDDIQEEIAGTFNYAVKLYKTSTINSMIETYKCLLQQIATTPEVKIRQLAYLSPANHQQIIYTWNQANREYPENSTIHRLFEEQVVRTPNNIAVVYENSRLTYQELNYKANQLAYYLREAYAVTADDLIILCLDRSEYWLIAILATLKAGAAYVPLDPSYPEERITYVLRDTNAKAILTNHSHQNKLEEIIASNNFKTPVELLGSKFNQQHLASFPTQNLEEIITSTNLAYVIYTSGTTGTPKGVLQQHNNVHRLLSATEDWYHFNSNDVWTLFHSYVFDFSVWEIWGALCYGGKLIVPTYEQTRDTNLFYNLCKEHAVTILNQTPTAFYQFMEIALSEEYRDRLLTKLKYVIFGGEALNLQQLLPWFNVYGYDKPILVNMYGITETTVHVSYKPLRKTDIGHSSHIGRQIPDQKIYILNTNLAPCPVGACGELYIGGAGLARGYLNLRELTTQRFVANPFQSEEEKLSRRNSILYKTGDLARYLPDGNIEYIGRNDFQVKIRGFRIELGEIENRLASYNGVKQAVVLVKDRLDSEASLNGSKYLIAYYVANVKLDEEEIHMYLSEYLPEYMLPSILVHLECFPLTLNGKLDRHALPNPGFSNSSNSYVPPRNEVEAEVCAIYGEVLGLSNQAVSIHDDFFRLGGDSISSIQLVGRLRQRLKLNISVKDVFSCKTVEKLYEQRLATQLYSSGVDEYNIIHESGELFGEVGLLAIQKWFFSNVSNGAYQNPWHWNHSFLIRVKEIDKEILQYSFDKLIAYHDAFRFSYSIDESGNYHQNYCKVNELESFKLRYLNRSLLSEIEYQKALSEWQSNFDLYGTKGLYSIGYIDGFPDGSSRIFFALHHLLIDTVSWRIIVHDLKELYSKLMHAKQTGRLQDVLKESSEKLLGQKGTSYRQWVSLVDEYPKINTHEIHYWEKVASEMEGNKDKLIQLVKAGADYSYADFSIDQSNTALLLTQSNKSYSTEINDLLLSAFGLALAKITKVNDNYITLEGHGREEISECQDISRTVGWFTSMYPVCLRVDNTDLRATIVTVKELLRAIPNKGIGYGALFTYTKYELPRVSFNYLGQLDQFKDEGNYWNISDENSGVAMHSANPDSNIINVNGVIINGELRFVISSKLSQDELSQLVNEFKQYLLSVIEHTVNLDRSYLTSSDINNLISKDYLDKLQKEKEVEAIYLANSLQQGFIYHILKHGNADSAYRVQLVFEYENALNVSLLHLAWQGTLRRYPSLRLRFAWEVELVQIIDKHQEVLWNYLDISSLAKHEQNDKITELIRLDRQLGYNLEEGNLLRISLIKLNNSHYACLMSNHHAILDGWSNSSLLNFVHDLYLKLLADPCNVDRILAELKAEESYKLCQHYLQIPSVVTKVYWEQQIAKIDELADLNRLFRPNSNYSDAQLPGVQLIQERSDELLVLNSEIYAKIKELSYMHGITINALLQYVWHKILKAHCNTTCTVVGTTISGRNLPVDGIEESVGLFINTLPLIVQHNDNDTILSCIQKIQDSINELNSHSNIDLAMLQINGQRLFNNIFVFENYPTTSHKADSLIKLKFIQGIEELDYPLGIIAYEHDSKIAINFKYDKALFNGEIIANLADTYNHFITDIVSGVNIADRLQNTHTFLSSSDYKQIIYDWNQTQKDYSEFSTIHQLFEEQVQHTPDNVAVRYEDIELTYQELNQRANQLAHYLRETYKIEGDDLIVLRLDRSEHMLITILATLKAGAAYVPLDPGYSRERISFILNDTKAKVILSNQVYQSDLESISNTNLELIDSIEMGQELVNRPSGNLRPNTNSQNLAYILYTSGTTGHPKGVMIQHQGIVNRLKWMNDAYPLSIKDNILQKTPYVFDVSVWELFWGVWYGATIVFAKPHGHKDAEYLMNLIFKAKISIIHFVPSMLSIFTQTLSDVSQQRRNELVTLRYIFCSGEALPLNYVKEIHKLLPLVELHNLYGPTEASIDVLHYNCSAKNLEAVYIGKPIHNTSAYILDDNLMPLTFGAVGELYIGGVGLARGYLNQRGLTEEKFIKNPFQTIEDKANGRNSRLYRTGDLACYRPDGNIEFIGRSDFQVKIRGFRIELGEIESVMMNYPGIKQCTILVKENLTEYDHNKYLIGYYVADNKLDEDSLFKYLELHLQDYSIPTTLIHIDALPLTTNGKLDRKRLPEPEFNHSAIYMAPRNDLEAQLSAIWSEVLGIAVNKIGVNQNFFKLGGNSILAIKVKTKLNRLEQFQHITVTDLFSHYTIEKLIGYVANGEATALKLSDVRLNDVNVVNKFDNEIAIIAVSGAFSGCDSVDGLWDLISNQHEGLKAYTIAECRKAGIPENILQNPNFIPVAGHIPDTDMFDPSFWGLSVGDAKLTDPQIRKFLEHCWHVLEQSNYIQRRKELNIGVFAGSGNSAYYYQNIINGEDKDKINLWEASIANSKDALATKVSYLLGLTGPANNINTACSTGLVTVVESCKSLAMGYCDFALAGGVSLVMPEDIGYTYHDGMIFSKDGHCRTFDKEATGTISGSGVGVVLLKRLKDAIKDGDHIIGVIKGYATNNDGDRKTGYTAPSVIGQTECILNAQKMAKINSTEIDYIECHGTATNLGDPIEIKALKEAFTMNTGKLPRMNKCKLGALKANIGHTDAAAGIGGLIKVCCMLQNNTIPGQANFKELNPELHLETTHFEVATNNTPWLPTNRQRIAGVSSFGVGGTNAHVIISDYSIPNSNSKSLAKTFSAQNFIIPLSAKSRKSLEIYRSAFINYLKNTDTTLADISYTLQYKRNHFDYRLAVGVAQGDNLIEKISNAQYSHALDEMKKTNSKLVFMFPGQGSQYANMGIELYKNDSQFKACIDKCISIANIYVREDLAKIMYPDIYGTTLEDINQTQWAQIALFIISYALAKRLEDMAINADSYIGHSIGEYVAATLVGLFSLDDAIKLVISRGQLMQQMAVGKMLAIQSSLKTIKDDLQQLECEVAVINAIDNIIVSGTGESIDEFKLRLDKKGILSTLLKTSHAYHCKLMDNAAAEFIDKFEGINFGKSTKRFISNLSGDFATREVAKPSYWSKHLRNTVQFDAGIHALRDYYKDNVIFIEVGAGKSLSSFVSKHTDKNNQPIRSIPLLATFKESQNGIQLSSQEDILSVLWVHGVDINFNKYGQFQHSKAVKLPRYQFDSKSCWIKRKTIQSDNLMLGVSKNSINDEFKIDDVEIIETGYSDWEFKIALIFCEILGIKQISLDDDFFKLGGNSILVIKLIELIRNHYQHQLKAADIFIAGSVRKLSQQIINAKNIYSPVVKLNKANNKPCLIMIHPGASGCEVYNNLANVLVNHYECYGIDNYNLRHENKFINLNSLANYYLKAVQDKLTDHKINLLGWSLGGLIALELACILEQSGYKDIKIHLLDSVIYNNDLHDLHNTLNHDIIKGDIRNYLRYLNGSNYIEMVIDNYDMENKIAMETITNKLKDSKIVLYKAMLEDSKFSNYASGLKYNYIKGLPYNNIDSIVYDIEQIKVINLNAASHENILEHTEISINLKNEI